MNNPKTEKVTGGGYRLPVIDYLKAVCIVLVIFNHSGVFAALEPPFFMIVDMAVPVFMILSGYVTGLNSADKSAAQLYKGKRILRKLLRYIVPMFITFFVFGMLWVAGRSILNRDDAIGREIVRRFIYFEFGPGAFYFPIIIEFLFLSPLMLCAVKRFGFHGVLLFGLVDFFFEICASYYGLKPEIYRILIFRYLFAIALGMYIGLYPDVRIKDEWLVALLVVGLIYILLPSFCDYQYRFFVAARASTSMIAVMYIFPVIYLILHYGKGHMGTGKVGSVLELIGRASYHIMCTQMIYYSVREYLYHIFDVSTLGKAAVLLCDTTVSLLTGLTFYCVDNRFLTGRLVKFIARASDK